MKKADQWSGLALSILAAGMIWLLPSLYGNLHNPGPGFFRSGWAILGGMSIVFVQTTGKRRKDLAKSWRDVRWERCWWSAP
jgi:hypothetical protein